MSRVGYIRVSSEGQNTARQDVLMRELGVDKVYTDKISGKSADRPQLKAMMNALQAGDTVVVESISRFARNTKDLLSLVDELTNKGVAFVSKKENFDTSTASGRFILTMFGAIAELEREYIRDRQAGGIAAAKERGVYTTHRKGGKPRQQVNAVIFEQMYQSYTQGKISLKEAAKALDLGQTAMFKRIKEREEVGEGYSPNKTPRTEVCKDEN